MCRGVWGSPAHAVSRRGPGLYAEATGRTCSPATATGATGTGIGCFGDLPWGCEALGDLERGRAPALGDLGRPFAPQPAEGASTGAPSSSNGPPDPDGLREARCSFDVIFSSSFFIRFTVLSYWVHWCCSLLISACWTLEVVGGLAGLCTPTGAGWLAPCSLSSFCCSRALLFSENVGLNGWSSWKSCSCLSIKALRCFSLTSLE
mmetsp:Transcript_7866/g.15111  ORF Transcript_7866/g.15111 Transcript_7866/m.15111 type:complete len:205 (+) Transcript_7866:3173-3787(+)